MQSHRRLPQEERIMKKFLAVLLLAAAATMSAPAAEAADALICGTAPGPSSCKAYNATSLPKGLAGVWCSGTDDEKGETPYGPPLENGRCDAESVTFSNGSIRFHDPQYDDITCRLERFERRVIKGVNHITFTAKCPEEQVKASGWYWEHKAMNLKWESFFR
jgi:hypothetical protein